MVGSNCRLELPLGPCLEISQMQWVTYGLITMFNFLHSWLAMENVKREGVFPLSQIVTQGSPETGSPAYVQPLFHRV